MRKSFTLTLAGFEPAIPWFVVRCLIRWATGPFKGVVTEQERGLNYPCLGMLSRNVTCYCPSTFTEANKKDSLGSTEIWTWIAGFRVLSANHYTIEPWHGERRYFFSLVFVLAFFRVWYCGKERHHTFNFFMRKLFVSCFSETQWTVYSRGGFWYFLNLFANSFRYCLLF